MALSVSKGNVESAEAEPPSAKAGTCSFSPDFSQAERGLLAIRFRRNGCVGNFDSALALRQAQGREQRRTVRLAQG